MVYRKFILVKQNIKVMSVTFIKKSDLSLTVMVVYNIFDAKIIRERSPNSQRA